MSEAVESVRTAVLGARGDKMWVNPKDDIPDEEEDASKPPPSQGQTVTFADLRDALCHNVATAHAAWIGPRQVRSYLRHLARQGERDLGEALAKTLAACPHLPWFFTSAGGVPDSARLEATAPAFPDTPEARLLRMVAKAHAAGDTYARVDGDTARVKAPPLPWPAMVVEEGFVYEKRMHEAECFLATTIARLAATTCHAPSDTPTFDAQR